MPEIKPRTNNLYRLPRLPAGRQVAFAPRNDEAGFTLFEILLVLALSVSIVAFGAIGLSHLQALFQLRSSADEIKARLEYGRELAIANKDNKNYSLTLSGSSINLLAGTQTVSQYQVPTGIVLVPSSLVWNFSPTTGKITSCDTCQLILNFRGLSDLIIVQPNGLVN